MTDAASLRTVRGYRVDTALGPLTVHPSGTITRALQAGQWWDVHLKPILDEAPVGWALDIGAHFGWFTLYLAQRHQRVIALEPWPETFLLLQQNLRTWIYGVEAWPVAAYDRPACLGFAPESDVTDAGSFSFREGGGPPYISTIVLDQYLPPDAPITCIKCDAQGADLRALRGLQQTIQRCRPLIVFEWEEGLAAAQGDTWEDYARFFAAMDYRIDRITTDYWDYVARPN